MKKFVAATIAALAISVGTPLLAADRTTAPWTGCYLGGHGGYSFGQLGTTEIPPSALSDTGLGNGNANGGFGGGQIGCDYQSGLWVLGLETTFSGANITGQNLTPSQSFYNRVHTEFFGTITGRIGYTAGPALYYLKGGAAYVNSKFSEPQIIGGGVVTPEWESTATKWGGAVGAGIEYMFAPNWSWKFEYDYVGLSQNENLACINPGLCAGPLSVRNRQQFQSVLLGINYRFGH